MSDSTVGWHPHGGSWAYWDGTRWLDATEAAQQGLVAPAGPPPPKPDVAPPGWWQASDGQWYPPHLHPSAQGAPSYPPPVAKGPTNGMAIASLVLSLLWFAGAGAVLAVIFGLIARRDINRSQGRQSGRGLATAGLVIGLIGLALSLVFWFGIFHSDPSDGFCNHDRELLDPDC